MARIELRGSAGLCAEVDDCDADLGDTRWYRLKVRGSRTTYARSGGKPTLYLHRLVAERMGPIAEGFEVDHVDGDGLNNRRSNLRLVTRSQNIQAAHDRLPYDRSNLPEAAYVHTIKRTLATGEVREYRVLRHSGLIAG